MSETIPSAEGLSGHPEDEPSVVVSELCENLGLRPIDDVLLQAHLLGHDKRFIDWAQRGELTKADILTRRYARLEELRHTIQDLRAEHPRTGSKTTYNASEEPWLGPEEERVLNTLLGNRNNGLPPIAFNQLAQRRSGWGDLISREELRELIEGVFTKVLSRLTKLPN